jgi:uncharacterized membrane protein
MDVKIFLLGVFIFLLADYLFLGLFMKDFWKKELGSSMRDNINIKSMFIPALIVYILLALGITLFVLPLTDNLNFLITFLYGAFFGLIVYGVYDLTNYIIITNYTWRLALIDIIWGSVISGIATLIMKTLSNSWIK